MVQESPMIFKFYCNEDENQFCQILEEVQFGCGNSCNLGSQVQDEVGGVYYPQIYGSDALRHIKEASDDIKRIFNEYAVSSSSRDQDSTLPDGSLSCTNNGTGDRLRGFDKFLHETSTSQNTISNKYLEEPIFQRNNNDFNILNWWKVHTPRYTILSMMARDVLGIPVATLGQDLVFSNRGRVLDHHRSTLNPVTREALVCSQDWLQVESEESKPSCCITFR
ncbi:hypothetical protein ACH5RR_028205 [Cinchona calisaya]|uniref:HAT C-terminal dimerisation domain-containing protein n=1 Tax=Cinchona calisaya TaxID=153742 RepID=A0ABD2YQ21_9GENT